MTRTPLIVAIDGGQSSTRTMLLDSAGTVLGACRTGPSNHIHEPGGLDRQYRALHEGVRGAFDAAALQTREVDVAFIGLTGSGHLDTVRRAVPAKQLQLTGDIDTAFAGALPNLRGCVVIAGTGSIAYGRDAQGGSHRTGGWGYIAGDEGSGYDIGRQAFRAVYQAHDGRGPETSLREALLDRFRANDLLELRRVLYGSEMTRHAIASVASLVGAEAAAGDATALRILADAGTALAGLVLGVLAHLDPDEPPLVSAIGGVLGAGHFVLDPFMTAIRGHRPHAQYVTARFDPLRGAAILGLRELGITVTEEIQERLAQPINFHARWASTRDAEGGHMKDHDRITGYFSQVEKQLRDVLEAEHDNLLNIANVWADALADDKMIYVFGSGHSRFIAGEMYWRAGGLAPVVQIEDPTEGMAERFEGYAEILIDQYDIATGDVLIVISNSGINPVPIEIAQVGRARGATVVALTSLEHSRKTPSRHGSGRHLFDVVDHVIDTRGEYGDAVMPVSGREWKVAPTSTAVSVTILNALVAQTAEVLAQRGVVPPVLVSSNVPEGDEHNKALSQAYWRRLARFPRRPKS